MKRHRLDWTRPHWTKLDWIRRLARIESPDSVPLSSVTESQQLAETPLLLFLVYLNLILVIGVGLFLLLKTFAVAEPIRVEEHNSVQENRSPATQLNPLPEETVIEDVMNDRFYGIGCDRYLQSCPH